MGRAGRGGEPSICVFLHLKNQRLPKEMRPFFKADSAFCQRRALTQIFTLHDTDGDMSCISFGVMRFPLYFFISVVYATEEARVGCSEACLDLGRCACSKCKYISYRLLSTVGYIWCFYSCCTNCTATCISCPLGTKPDADQLVKAILGLGGAEYEWALYIEFSPANKNVVLKCVLHGPMDLSQLTPSGPPRRQWQRCLTGSGYQLVLWRPPPSQETWNRSSSWGRQGVVACRHQEWPSARGQWGEEIWKGRKRRRKSCTWRGRVITPLTMDPSSPGRSKSEPKSIVFVTAYFSAKINLPSNVHKIFHCGWIWD